MTQHNVVDELVEIEVNGASIRVPRKATILQALRIVGLSVPTLCYDERFRPSSSCRVCEVTIKGEARPACACATLVREGMSIATHTPELEALDVQH